MPYSDTQERKPPRTGNMRYLSDMGESAGAVPESVTRPAITDIDVTSLRGRAIALTRVGRTTNRWVMERSAATTQ